MTVPSLLLAAAGVSMDNTAAAIGIGVARPARPMRTAFSVAASFGIFQTAFPALGWLAGAAIAPFLRGYAGVVVFAVLAFVAYRMLRSAFGPQEKGYDPASVLTVLALGCVTSLDSMAVGFSFGIEHEDLARTCLSIGAVTAVLAFIGVVFGERLGDVLGRRSRIAGGAILLVVALRALLSG